MNRCSPRKRPTAPTIRINSGSITIRCISDQHSENSGWLTSAHLIDYAKSIGLNVSDFTTCLSSAKYKHRCRTISHMATSKNIDRTPSFLVNGRLVYADTVTAAIETAVKAAAAGNKQR